MLTNALIHHDRHRSHPASQPSKANGQGEPGSGELGLRRARPTVALVASRSPRPLPDVVVARCARVHGSTRSRPRDRGLKIDPLRGRLIHRHWMQA